MKPQHHFSVFKCHYSEVEAEACGGWVVDAVVDKRDAVGESCNMVVLGRIGSLAVQLEGLINRNATMIALPETERFHIFFFFCKLLDVVVRKGVSLNLFR